MRRKKIDGKSESSIANTNTTIVETILDKIFCPRSDYVRLYKQSTNLQLVFDQPGVVDVDIQANYFTTTTVKMLIFKSQNVKLHVPVVITGK